MRPLLRLLLTSFVCCLIAARARAQTTDPVGFMTLPIKAGAVGSASLSFRSLGLTRAEEFEAVASSISSNAVSSPTPDSITCLGAGWIDDQFNGANGAYYVEIVGPIGSSGAGTSYDIAGTNAAAQTITLASGQRLASGLSLTTAFRIRKHWTIASVFGAANEGGLLGGASTTADQILIFNGTAFDTYYYSVNGVFSGTGWRKTTDDATDQAGRIMFPDDAVIIRRLPTTAAAIVLTGAAKTGQTSFPVFPGTNYLSNPYAVAMTLAESGLYTTSATTGLAEGTSTTADQILIYNGTGYYTYYYSDGTGLAGPGWRRADDDATACDEIEIPAGTSFIVKRKGSAAFDWVAPQHPLSLPSGSTLGGHFNPLSISTPSTDHYTLSWLPLDPRPYQLETSPDLISWSDLGSPVVGSGSPVTVTENLPGIAQKYYRLRRGAIRSGFDSIAMERNDDGYTHTGANGDHMEDNYVRDPNQSALAVPIGFNVSLFELPSVGNVFVNTNGNITFSAELSQFRPIPLVGNNLAIIAPFWADADTRASASNVVRYGQNMVNGRLAFGVTWERMGYFSQHTAS